MQVEIARHLVARKDAPHAVAAGVEWRRINTDAELPGQDRQDSSPDTAFRRHSHRVGPLAGKIVHPARGHDAENAFDAIRAQGALPTGDPVTVCPRSAGKLVTGRGPEDAQAFAAALVAALTG